MIQWWGWILIWTGLVLGLLIMLALFAWWLFRKAMRVLDDLGELAETTSVFDGVEEADLPKPALAVLADLQEVRAREDARRFRRSRRRSDRRLRRLERARRITSVDASQVRWPADWYK